MTNLIFSLSISIYRVIYLSNNEYVFVTIKEDYSTKVNFTSNYRDKQIVVTTASTFYDTLLLTLIIIQLILLFPDKRTSLAVRTSPTWAQIRVCSGTTDYPL